MHTIDTAVQNYFTYARSADMTQVMFVFTNLFNPSMYSFYAFLLFALLIAVVRNIRYSLLFSFSIIFSTLIVYLMKIALDIHRPVGGLVQVIGPSFPSFHATIATIFFVMLMYIFDQELNSFLRALFNALSVAAIFAVAFSRVYLGVHWVSDVFAGILLGCLLSYFYIILFRYVMDRPGPTSMIK